MDILLDNVSSFAFQVTFKISFYLLLYIRS